MKNKRPTSHQVAELAGVSRTTVSLILNKAPLSEKMSQETIDRVHQAAHELGYFADAAARSLKSGRTRTLGLVVSDSHHMEVDAFLPQLLYGLMEASNKRGFRVIVESLKASKHDAYKALINAKQIDGLVVINPRKTDINESLHSLINSGFPIVNIGSIDHPKEYKVVQMPLMDVAVKHLISLGHKRIAHITYGPETYQGAIDRLNVYQEILTTSGLAVDSNLIRFGNYSAKSGYQAMQSLLDSEASFTGLFAGNDTIALGAMAAIHQAGLRIPEDIAVIGYDDIPIAAFAVPPLTTVSTNPKEQGRRAGELLIQLLKGEKPKSYTIQLEDAELIIRQSCGARLKLN